jgi:hypothetical protein
MMVASSHVLPRWRVPNVMVVVSARTNKSNHHRYIAFDWLLFLQEQIKIIIIISVYLVSDLEGSDNGDPINGIVYCLSCKSRSSHVLGYLFRASE